MKSENLKLLLNQKSGHNSAFIIKIIKVYVILKNVVITDDILNMQSYMNCHCADPVEVAANANIVSYCKQEQKNVQQKSVDANVSVGRT